MKPERALEIVNRGKTCVFCRRTGRPRRMPFQTFLGMFVGAMMLTAPVFLFVLWLMGLDFCRVPR
jgi:hypothetical protein